MSGLMDEWMSGYVTGGQVQEDIWMNGLLDFGVDQIWIWMNGWVDFGMGWVASPAIRLFRAWTRAN